LTVRAKIVIVVLLAGLVAGALLAIRHRPLAAAPTASLRMRELHIVGADGAARVSIGPSREASAVIRITNERSTAAVEAGVHANGFPFLLVSDGGVRNFALGRVDGVQASPIVVFRTDDAVRMVLGLDMIERAQSPFLVRYTADGRKHDVIGRYCDRPDRVCVR